MGFAIVTAAAVEPVSLALAKQHLRVDSSDDDALVIHYIRSATDWCERYTHRCFVTATVRETFDGFPCAFLTRRSPLVAVTSIQYVDTEGATQTLASSQYVVQSDRDPGRVVEAYNVSWPTARLQPSAVTVTYTAGYGTDPQSVPSAIKGAILLLVGDMYAHREQTQTGTIVASIPMGVKQLLGPYTLHELPLEA